MADDPALHQAYYLRVKYSERSEDPASRIGVKDDKKEEPGDVTSFVCVRNAIGNTASFSILTIQLPIEYFLQAQTYITHGTFPQVVFELYLIDTKDKSCKEYPFGKPVLKNPIMKKELQMVYIKELESTDPEKRIIHALIILNDPLLYSLGTKLTYNKVIRGKPIDYLTSYENFLSGIYNKKGSPPTFKFHKITNEKFITKSNMKQMLIKPKVDLQIPKMLISWYKVYQTPTTYFFDEYRYDKDNQAAINCYLLNFGDIEAFEKGPNFRENKDSKVEENQASQNIEKSFPLIDPNSSLLTPITKLNVYDYNMHYIGASFLNENFKLPFYTNILENAEYLNQTNSSPREVNMREQRNELMHNANINTFIDLYSPDNSKLATERYTLTKETYKNIPTIETFSFTNTFFETFQFGKRYNLNLIDLIETEKEYEQFVFTPVCIVNIFHRASANEPVLKHTARIQFAKFNDSVLKDKADLNYNEKITNNAGKNIDSKPGKETPANVGADNKTEEQKGADKVDDAIKKAQNIKCNQDIIDNKDNIKDKLKSYIKTKSKGSKHPPSDAEIDKIIENAAKSENPHLVISTIAKESGFQPGIDNKGTNPNASIDHGLMQVNIPAGSSAAQQFGKYGITNTQQLYDVDTNMKIGMDRLFVPPPSKRGKNAEAQAFYDSCSDVEKSKIVYGGATSLTGMKFVLANMSYAYQDLTNYLGGTELKPTDPSCAQNSTYKGDIRNLSISEINEWNKNWGEVNNKNVSNKTGFTKPPTKWA